MSPEVNQGKLYALSDHAATTNGEDPRYWHDAEVVLVNTSFSLVGDRSDLYDEQVS